MDESDKFEFTIKIGPDDEFRGLVEAKSKVRKVGNGDKDWVDVPLAAVPIIKDGWPPMPDYMDGRQYYLWWKNGFKLQNKEGWAGFGEPEIFNPYPEYPNAVIVMAGANSRRWGA
jgi:hypothetical protein